MSPAANKIIEEITRLALELPENQKQQMLAMISRWKKNRRKAQREKYSELLNFSAENHACYGQARDISATGVFIESKGEFYIGEHIQLVLSFISASNPVKIGGTVVRKEAGGIGVQFDNSSQTRLKQLDSIISKHAMILRQR
jgi:Tfp pilus assembly protein PilZ